MNKNLKSLDNVNPLASLSVGQKLELYQIIAFAETGNTKGVIDRARNLLKAAKEPVQIDEPYAALLRQRSLPEILELASRP